MLDIDNNKMSLPEDLPNLPNRDELIAALNALLVKPSVTQPNDPFSLLKLSTFSPPSSPNYTTRHSERPSFAERRMLKKPPKLKMLRQCNVEYSRDWACEDDKVKRRGFLYT